MLLMLQFKTHISVAIHLRVLVHATQVVAWLLAQAPEMVFVGQLPARIALLVLLFNSEAPQLRLEHCHKGVARKMRTSLVGLSFASV